MPVWMNFVRCGYFKNKYGDPTFWNDYCNRYKVSFHQNKYFENGMTFNYEERASLRHVPFFIEKLAETFNCHKSFT